MGNTSTSGISAKEYQEYQFMKKELKKFKAMLDDQEDIIDDIEDIGDNQEGKREIGARYKT